MFFDVHTHVQFSAFKEDADAVIQRALDAGVWMVNVGTQRDTSEAAVKMAHAYRSGVFATVGLHPIHTEASYHDEKELGGAPDIKGFTSRGEDFDPGYYEKLASDPKVVGIGECGLDYYRLSDTTKKKQEEVFLRHIMLASAVRKPLMIHCRKAFSDIIPMLKSNFVNLKSASPGIIHFFSGTEDDAKKLLDLGFSFSFGGVITFTHDYDDVVRFIPLERIVTETDAPYVAPVPNRGKRNEPAYVIETVKKLAELKYISLEKTAESTAINACRIFGVQQAQKNLPEGSIRA